MMQSDRDPILHVSSHPILPNPVYPCELGSLVVNQQVV